MKARFTPKTVFPTEIDSMLDRAIALLRAGEVIGVPTETVYGLAADATNPAAVAKLIEQKKRGSFHPISVLCASAQMAFDLGNDVPESALRLAARFWPGPLTMIVRRGPGKIPDLLTAGQPFVGVRVPDHPLTLALLERFASPLAAPSANRSGHISPTTAAAVRREFGEEIALLIDGGPCRVGLESTVISFASPRPVLLRQGGIPQELLEAEIGPIDPAIDPNRSRSASDRPPRRYLLRTPLVLVRGLEEIPASERKKAGLLAWGPCPTDFAICRSLSPSYRLEEAATKLFGLLRELQESGVDRIFALLLPEQGLGRAINERLRKGAAGSNFWEECRGD